MSAIITDQLRILNAKNLVSYVKSTENSFYCFIGLTNSSDYSSDWNIFPPSPKDNFDEENDYWDTMVAVKKINPTDISLAIRKITWKSGNTYDMYRHDVSRDNLSRPSNATSLYSSNFYVINSDYRVYICIHNGTTPENPNGRPSLDEPTFVDLEPKSAGTSGDGYVWKYLFTIKPSEIIKFDSINFVSVPADWETSTDPSIVSIRENANPLISGQIKNVVIKNRGSSLGSPNRVYTNVPIKGDGIGAESTVIVGNDSKVDSIIVSSGGYGYTYATVDLIGGGIPSGTIDPIFDVIIPPQNGHGYDIYRELGAYNVFLYTRLENDIENPDFIVGNQISRIGIIKNPLSFESNQVLSLNKASCIGAIKLIGENNFDDYKTSNFNANEIITQTVGVGITAVGRVISYSKETGVLKYWQDRTLFGFNYDKSQNTVPTYGFNKINFTSNVTETGSLRINGGDSALVIDLNFSGISTSINNRTYNLGQSFENGISNPEVKPYSGDIVYVDNRPSITRSVNQKEDIKVILQF